jgi:hypothetical protein
VHDVRRADVDTLAATVAARHVDESWHSGFLYAFLAMSDSSS